MPMTWPSPFFEKNFFRPKIPEICRKSPFLQILFGLFPYISLFFHLKTSLITMPTIKHGSFVNLTDFCSRNFLKIAGTADLRRKNGISWISRAILYIFHEILHTVAKWQCLECDGAWFSKNIFFRPKMPEIYAGKTGFLAFSRDFIISFQKCIIAIVKIWPSPIFKKNFFPAENTGNMPKIAVFVDFHRTFSLSFVVFSLKNITNNTAHH